MDTTTAAVIIVIIFALIIIAAFMFFRNTRASVKGPFGTGLEIDGSNDPVDPKPAINIEDVESKKGGIVVNDSTGRGANVKGAKTADDIMVSSSNPKDQPPA